MHRMFMCVFKHICVCVCVMCLHSKISKQIIKEIINLLYSLPVGPHLLLLSLFVLLFLAVICLFLIDHFQISLSSTTVLCVML